VTIVAAEDAQMRRAVEALGRALTPGPDDDAHLSEDVLDALAAGTLDAADQEWAASHLEGCARCAEDLADRRAVQQTIDALPEGTRQGPPPASRRRGAVWLIAPLGLATAAAILLAVVLQRDQAPPLASTPSAGDATPAVADALAPEDRALVTRVLAAGRVELPDDIAFLRGREGTLLGGRASGPALTLDEPVGTAVIGVRPELQWSRVEDARGYTVRVFDEQFTEVARAQVTTTAWTLDRDLTRGAVYSWQVTARTPSGEQTVPVPPQPEARFRVLSPGEAATQARLRAGLADDPLARGILEARAGLLAEASASLRQAQAVAATRAAAITLLASLADARD